jgi:hypothetical protein
MMASSAQLGALLKLRLSGLLLKCPGEVPSLNFGLRDPMGLREARVSAAVVEAPPPPRIPPVVVATAGMGAAAVMVAVVLEVIALFVSIDIGTVEVGVCINAIRFAAAAAAAMSGWSFLRTSIA